MNVIAKKVVLSRTVPGASESRTFRLIVGALGSALCLMPLFAMARAVGLVGLPPHGDELIGDLCFLFVVLSVVGGGVWSGWRGGREAADGDGGGHNGGDQGRDVHQYPLLRDD